MKIILTKHCLQRREHYDVGGKTQRYTEVDTDLFIRTNRTCEGILFKAFGKEYILDEKVIESFYEISSRYPTKQIPRFKSYSKIIMALQEQECQFAKYGFQKPEFECELWKEVNGKIIGIVENNSTQTVSFWWDLTTGRINNDCTNMYDLTPIKKP